MEFVKSMSKKETLELSELLEKQEIDGEVSVEGAIHSIRDMGEIAFVILRKREGLLQTVWEEGKTNLSISDLKEGDCIRAFGVVRKEERAPHQKELLLSKIQILSSPAEPLPLPVDKWEMKVSLEKKLNLRSIALRNVKERARFRIQEAVGRGFREYLYGQGFTEIHTPKIGAKGAEGGSNLFKLSYFHQTAVLEQSPQLYKQMMVGVFDRVFETGPVFRAEKHNTRRHLNEYTSLDFEMGYIDSFQDICTMEAGFLKYTVELLKSSYEKELELLHVNLPEVKKMPLVHFSEAKKLVSEKYNRRIRTPYDLEPEEEELIGKYFKEECGADFVFVTHYPSKKRPFYVMDDPEDETYTLSFDLLFRGMEVTTGGQRIHDYKMLTEKMEKRGMSREGLESYLDTFKYGMPPHGGLGIGLERFTMQLLEEENVRQTCLFPRDLKRLVP